MMSVRRSSSCRCSKLSDRLSLTWIRRRVTAVPTCSVSMSAQRKLERLSSLLGVGRRLTKRASRSNESARNQSECGKRPSDFATNMCTRASATSKRIGSCAATVTSISRIKEKCRIARQTSTDTDSATSRKKQASQLTVYQSHS